MRAILVATVMAAAISCAGNGGPASGDFGAACRADCDCASSCCVGATGGHGPGSCAQCGRPAFDCDPAHACGGFDTTGTCEQGAFGGCCVLDDGGIEPTPVIDARP